MVDAAITLLQDHTVAEVTNVAVASVSQTQPSYVTRYFGSRDEFLLAVAEELAGRIAARNLGLRVLLAGAGRQCPVRRHLRPPRGGELVQALAVPRRHRSPRRSPRQGDGPLLAAGIENLQRQLGFPPEEARTWALVTLISVLGYRVSGGVLGITAEEASAVADKVIGSLLRDAEAHRGTTPPPGA